MNKPVRVVLLSVCCAAIAAILLGCAEAPTPTLVLAPPGPADLGPAVGLSTPPPGAIVFDLNYRAQTGGESDIDYHSYWGYGGSSDEAKASSFLQDVGKKSARLYPVQNPSLTGREWAAVEYHRRQASALYFDLNADGKLSDNERIPPTRKTEQGVGFITPDFSQPLPEGGKILSRALLQVNFYGGSSEPNCMWSPAALLESAATVEGKSARLLLFSSNPGGGFDKYGSCTYSLLLGDQTNTVAGQYVPRETLSSLISSESQFYHLTIEGQRSNGLPARVLLVKDTSPTGMLAVKLIGSNSPNSTLTSLYLQGLDDKTVFFRIGTSKGNKIDLPTGSYSLNSGAASYGTSSEHDWEVSFSQGPQATVKVDEVLELTLGHPVLTVRAIEEKDRYNRQATDSATFKKGTRIYLEPRIVGKGKEALSRFRQSTVAGGEKADRPPRITITGPDGKQLLSKVMEYG